MQAEAAQLRHDSDLSNAPKCERWVNRVIKWYADLGLEAGVDDAPIHLRFRKCVARWERLCAHLPPALSAKLLHIIQTGFKVPWASGVVDPSRLRHDCRTNPPMMKTRTAETWAIIAKSIAAGAISPCDVSVAKPPVICPVFFVDELGKLRLVHNLKWLNAKLEDKYFPVWLETLQRIRAILPLDGWMTTTDFSSAYFHVPLVPGDTKFVSFALAEDEIPREAVAKLRRDNPQCEKDGRFFFSYQCINFGFIRAFGTNLLSI